MKNEFKNPWPLAGAYDSTKHGRVMADIPREELLWLKRNLPRHGSIQITLNLLLAKLKQSIINQNIRYENIEDYIANCEIRSGAVRAAVDRADAPAPTQMRRDCSGATSTQHPRKA
jgi:uncharacterized protein (DUF3820 family)